MKIDIWALARFLRNLWEGDHPMTDGYVVNDQDRVVGPPRRCEKLPPRLQKSGKKLDTPPGSPKFHQFKMDGNGFSQPKMMGRMEKVTAQRLEKWISMDGCLVISKHFLCI